MDEDRQVACRVQASTRMYEGGVRTSLKERSSRCVGLDNKCAGKGNETA